MKNSLLFLFLMSFVSCKKEEAAPTPIDCSTITLDASMMSENFQVFRGEPATITITGTPNSIVKLENGTIVNRLSIGPTGVTTHIVTPQVGTTYILSAITTETEECLTLLNSVVSISVIPNPFSNAILGTWTVRNDTFGEAANSVTFNDDGTGSAPGVSDSAFAEENPNSGSSYSENFTWTHGNNSLTISYKFPGESDVVRIYQIEAFSSSEIIVIETFGDENKYILRPS